MRLPMRLLTTSGIALRLFALLREFLLADFGFCFDCFLEVSVLVAATFLESFCLLFFLLLRGSNGKRPRLESDGMSLRK